MRISPHPLITLMCPVRRGNYYERVPEEASRHMEDEDLVQRFKRVRQATERLCAPLETEDYVVQTSADVSPPKWHLAHTTWFFERAILACGPYAPYNPDFYRLFNSYYESFGERWPKDARGTVSRPTVSEVFRYRRAINERIIELLENSSRAEIELLRPLLILGLNHEEQHQELLIADIKHILGTSPLTAVYLTGGTEAGEAERSFPLTFLRFEGGLIRIGADGEGFAWDNERPRHRIFLEPFSLSNRLVTCGEFLEFMEDGGYENPLLWLSDGWDARTRDEWKAPLYWRRGKDGQWIRYSLAGESPIATDEPVGHVSFYEADAYARWRGCRLPTEFEWEHAAESVGAAPDDGNLLDQGKLRPCRANRSTLPAQMIGDLWEWTGSSYLPYPGYRPFEGPLGEYNGKFMSNQMVLRGGSCATPRGHLRLTYRNFFQCEKRWQFTGIRLAQ